MATKIDLDNLELTFDFDSLTGRMLEDFERKTGVSLLAMAGDKNELDLSSMPMTAISGIIWLALKMSGYPDATYDDARDIPLAKLSFVEEPPADPPSPG